LQYEKALALKDLKESAVFVNLGGVIALVPVDHEQGLAQRLKKLTLNANAIIYIETRSLKSVYENVQRVGALVLGQIDYGYGRRFFRCLDSDGNIRLFQYLLASIVPRSVL
jgi:hypothetical protein